MSSPTQTFKVLAVLAGKIAPFRAPDEPSAIDKRPVDGPATIAIHGLTCDEQADRRYHGGADKALHHYAFDHYDEWKAVLGDHPLLATPGGFGENIATVGLVEEEVWLGDRFRLGSAIIEVSHGRQPCWKLGHRFGHPPLAARIVKNKRCGWYYRVIEGGVVNPGDGLERIARGLAEWPIDKLFYTLIGGGHRGQEAALKDLAHLPVLAEAWRHRADQLLG